MYPYTFPTTRNPETRASSPEVLLQKCSLCDHNFRKPNQANAAQKIGEEFRQHNEEKHFGLASLSIPEISFTP